MQRVKPTGWVHFVVRGYAWCALPIVALASWFNGQQVVLEEPWAVTAWLLGAVPMTVVGLLLLPWMPSARPLWASSGRIIGSMSVLLVWAAVRTVGFATCIAQRDGQPWQVCYPSWVAWMPLGQAAVTMLLAWLLVAAVPEAKRRSWLLAVAVVIVVMTGIGLLRALLHPRGFNRLGTGLGGAAVLSVALVLAAVLLIAASVMLRRWRYLNVGLALAAVLGVLLTFSRAGLGLLVIVAVVLLLVYGKTFRARTMWLALAGLVLLAGVAASVFPELAARLLTFGDPARATNLATSLMHWASSWQHIVFGVGNAAVWPWYGVDAGLIWAPETGELVVAGIDGALLVNPHSLYLGVLVELGLVGIAILLASCVAVVRLAVQKIGDRVVHTGVIAAAVCLLAFAVDTYVLRNPGVSFVWWLVLLSGWRGHGPDDQLMPVDSGPAGREGV